jgi:hypothetical protein
VTVIKGKVVLLTRVGKITFTVVFRDVVQFEGKKHIVKVCIIHYGVHNLKYCELKIASDICEMTECILVGFTEVSEG